MAKNTAENCMADKVASSGNDSITFEEIESSMREFWISYCDETDLEWEHAIRCAGCL